MRGVHGNLPAPAPNLTREVVSLIIGTEEPDQALKNVNHAGTRDPEALLAQERKGNDAVWNGVDGTAPLNVEVRREPWKQGTPDGSSMKTLLSMTGGTIITYVAIALSNVLTAHFLLPTGQGELTAALLWPSLLGIVANCGVANAVTYFTANGQLDRNKLLPSALALALVLGVVFILVGLAVIPLVLSHYRAEVRLAATVYLAYIPIVLLLQVLAASVQGSMRFGVFSALRPVVHVVYLTSVWGLSSSGQLTVHTAVLASLVSNVVGLLAFLAPALVRSELVSTPHWDTARSILSYGLKTHLGTVSSFMNLRLDQLVMSAWLAPQTLGIYSVAVTISSVACVPAQTISFIAFPTLASAKDRNSRAVRLADCLAITWATTVLPTIAMLVGAGLIVTTIYGSSFYPAAAPARILLIGSAVLALNMQLTASFRAFDRPLIASRAEIVGLSTTVCGLLIFLPLFSASGAALASTIAYSVSAMYMIRALKANTGIGPITLVTTFVKRLPHYRQLFKSARPQSAGRF